MSYVNVHSERARGSKTRSQWWEITCIKTEEHPNVHASTADRDARPNKYTAPIERYAELPAI